MLPSDFRLHIVYAIEFAAYNTAMISVNRLNPGRNAIPFFTRQAMNTTVSPQMLQPS